MRTALQVVYGQDILCPSRTRRWYQAFRTGCTTLVDLQRAHWRKTGQTPGNIQAVKAMVDADKSISFAAIMKQTGLKQTTVHRIIKKDLQLTLRSTKLVPAFLTPRHIVHGSRDTQLHLLMTGQRVIEHPPLSLDLSPCDFWLFSHIKSPLRGTQFQSLDALERAVTVEIGNIPAGDYWHTMLTSWPMRWARCINANGGYFEGLQ